MILVYILVCSGSIWRAICSDGFVLFFFKQKTAYEMRISDWSSDVCSSDLPAQARRSCCARCSEVPCQGRRTKTRESKSRSERLPREIQDELFPRPPAVFPAQSRAVQIGRAHV